MLAEGRHVPAIRRGHLLAGETVDRRAVRAVRPRPLLHQVVAAQLQPVSRAAFVPRLFQLHASVGLVPPLVRLRRRQGFQTVVVGEEAESQVVKWKDRYRVQVSSLREDVTTVLLEVHGRMSNAMLSVSTLVQFRRSQLV